MSSILPPEVVVAKINRYFNIMINIIFNYSGTINKFWGDAIMALWGLMSPADDFSPQVSSVEATIDMANALFDFNYALIEEGQKPIQMGVGLNTGTFLAGNVGSEKQMEYTVIGNSVNLASRIESKAARGQIYISDSTFERVKNCIYSIKMDPTSVKGKEEPIQIYSVRGFLDREFNDREFDRLTIPASYIDKNGEKHNGLILGITETDGTTMLNAHFKYLFPEDTEIEIKTDLPEFEDTGTLKLKVQTFDVINPEEGVKFYNYTLNVTETNDFFTEFMSSRMMKATVDVDDIIRQ
jgi:class 3 adenylate cyclase